MYGIYIYRLVISQCTFLYEVDILCGYNVASRSPLHQTDVAKTTCYLVTWVQHIMFDGKYIVKAAPPGGGRAKWRLWAGWQSLASSRFSRTSWLRQWYWGAAMFDGSRTGVMSHSQPTPPYKEILNWLESGASWTRVGEWMFMKNDHKILQIQMF